MKITRRSLLAGLPALAAGGATLAPMPRAGWAQGMDEALRIALARVRARDWPGALAAVQPAGPIAGDVVRWHWLRASEGRFEDYEAFLARRADWPGLPLLRARGEEAVAEAFDAGADPARVVAFFQPQPPRTAAGALALVAALGRLGQRAEAEAAAIAAWRSLPFDPDQQAAMLALAGPVLGPHHEARLDHLLWEERAEDAARMTPLVGGGWRRLAAARSALLAGQSGVDALVAAVPQALAQDAGLAHARFDWRLGKGREDDAASLMLQRSGSAADLGRPEAWARSRAFLVRELLEQRRDGQAYALAAGHRLTEGGDFAALEFLAGFIALRRLNRPEVARAHFRHLAQGVGTPISLARAHYWEARAEEAMGNAEAARTAHTRAAAHQTAYYGLLSAERLGLSLDPLLARPPAPADWREAAFLRGDVMQAAVLLQQAGDVALARRFILHMAETLDGRGLDQLGGLALSIGWDNLAVLVGKDAAARGIILPAAYFPVPDMVPGGHGLARPLALAIARRESEFDPQAISPAGARGLMQLMPGTAKLMAAKLGLRYRLSALTDDPAYNVRLGSAYLLELIEEFGPSIALVAAGYNAGPGRPRAWIESLGDPRRPDVDIVDWVEMVPFAETRTYIMRVIEGRVIYGDRLAGRPSKVSVTTLLKG